MNNPKGTLPVFNIDNFENYNCCNEYEKTFYVRPFNDHIKTNKFINVPHSHDFYLVLLVTKGSGIHRIDFNEYNVEKGSMFVLSPGQVHLWELSDDIDGYVLFFHKEYFLIDFTKDRLENMPFFRSTFSSPYFYLNEKSLKIIEDLFVKIYAEYSNRLIKYHEIIRLHLNCMFIQLNRFYIEENDTKSEFKYEIIQLNLFQKYIDEHFKNHLSVKEYASLMNISAKQLSTICKKSIGKSPLELIHERIILESKRLLTHSQLAVNGISEELNFSDNSYFIRLFKKNCGITPEKFRSSTQ